MHYNRLTVTIQMGATSSHLCLQHHATSAASTTSATSIIIMNSTPPTPTPTMAPIMFIPPVAVGVLLVDVTQSASAINESTSIGQSWYTSIILLWTRREFWLPLTHCSMYDSTCPQSGRPDSSARYNTSCWSLMQRKSWVGRWFTVNEHWHLELTADIMELVMSASFPSVFRNCKEYKHNPNVILLLIYLYSNHH